MVEGTDSVDVKEQKEGPCSNGYLPLTFLPSLPHKKEKKKNVYFFTYLYSFNQYLLSYFVSPLNQTLK